MLGQKEAAEALKPGLTKAIQEWMDNVCQSYEWEALNSYVGDNLASLMSDAAFAVLGGVVDVQVYLRESGE